MLGLPFRWGNNQHSLIQQQCIQESPAGKRVAYTNLPGFVYNLKLPIILKQFFLIIIESSPTGLMEEIVHDGDEFTSPIIHNHQVIAKQISTMCLFIVQ